MKAVFVTALSALLAQTGASKPLRPGEKKRGVYAGLRRVVIAGLPSEPRGRTWNIPGHDWQLCQDVRLDSFEVKAR